ncbi:hypothetical protein E2C01_088077 [Portunus trituberculatus]|uniref:Uncharacterized protein n=1 Tax=Portunus trituberculatus TaxID=210409 RepID=A0A5B7J9T6_PORTR|nr:hypothetical protein [Portunus trituberculatus]
MSGLTLVTNLPSSLAAEYWCSINTPRHGTGQDSRGQLNGSGRVFLRMREHLRPYHMLPAVDEPDNTSQDVANAAHLPSLAQQSQVCAPAKRQTRPPR